MKPLRIAVVGAGHLGRIHAKLLAEMPDVQLIGVADPIAAARDQVASNCHTQSVADYRQLIGKIDGAIVATPTRHHHAVAMELLRHGIALLVEKPLAASLHEADDLVEAADRYGTLLQVGHIERFNPAFTAVAPHVSAPQYIEAVRASTFTGRSTDIGVVYDLMIHDIDLTLALVGSPVTSVSAIGLAVLGRREDAAQARIEFANGCVANLSAARVSFEPTPRRTMQIWAAETFAAIDFGNRTASVVRPSEEVLNRQFDYETLGSEEKATFKERLFTEILRIEPLEIEPRNALADELRDFVDSVRRATSPKVTGAQARDAVSVAEAVLQSIREHAQPARRSEIPARQVPQPALRGPHWPAATWSVAPRQAS